eukprot:7147847-Prymnesium_polylepis.1
MECSGLPCKCESNHFIALRDVIRASFAGLSYRIILGARGTDKTARREGRWSGGAQGSGTPTAQHIGTEAVP